MLLFNGFFGRFFELGPILGTDIIEKGVLEELVLGEWDTSSAEARFLGFSCRHLPINPTKLSGICW